MIDARRLYICDQTKCGDRCSAKLGQCTHTTDIAYAKYRAPGYERKWCFAEENEPVLWEITHEEYNEAVERTGAWVPCKLAMPKEPCYCMITVAWKLGDVTVYHERVYWDGEKWLDRNQWAICFDVIAWAKWPDPWRE